jgi:hypothetical protein
MSILKASHTITSHRKQSVRRCYLDQDSFIRSLSGESMLVQGGQYAFSKRLSSRDLPFRDAL